MFFPLRFESSHTEWLKPNQYQSQTENPFGKAFSFLKGKPEVFEGPLSPAVAFARKGLLRLAEKNALRPTAGLIWDPIRAMLVGHSIGELIEAETRRSQRVSVDVSGVFWATFFP